ncbi:hypothetical protein [Chromobacterium amazonense]|uniref:hypothetical protein n=1 Tax=Chromobacterium amazonense TaxID=1382803 RepID=UPI0011137CA4|nr:hypothetical protein [Chromobacterium amazonense]
MFSMLKKSTLSGLCVFLGWMGLSQCVLSADINIPNSENLDSYRTMGPKAPVTFCRAVSCDSAKSLLLTSAEHVVPVDVNGNISINYTASTVSQGERNIVFNPAGGVPREMRINFKRLGFAFVPRTQLTGGEWTRLELELVNKSASCQGISRGGITIGAARGYALMFKAGVDCSFVFAYPKDGVKLMHFVVEYDFGPVDAFPVGTYVGNLGVLAGSVGGLNANLVDVFAGASVQLTVALTVPSYINIRVPDSNVVLEKHTDGALRKMIPVFIGTNSRFRFSYVGNSRSRHLVNDVYGNSVRCDAFIHYQEFFISQGGSVYIKKNVWDFSDVKLLLEFLISSADANAMFPGRYHGNVTVRFEAVL